MSETTPGTGRRSLEERLHDFDGATREGRVRSVIGPVIRASLPDARIGDRCRVTDDEGVSVSAEVVGFDEDGVVLMPLGSVVGLPVRARVEPEASSPMVPAGPTLRGRVLDALGAPIDDRMRPLAGAPQAPLHREPPPALTRQRIVHPLHTGIRVIDGLLTVGRGQRLGIFAAAGVGKSTLLSALARNVEADVVVLALIGERGREVRSFLEDDLGDAGRQKSVVVVSTSDQPALLRLRAAHTATAIAESFRDEGANVVLLMDSVTRFARALREVGLAAGEVPTRQGYPTSVFSELPQLFERAGNAEHGSITAFYTVLVSGDDMTEPVADETMSLLDGHFVLSRDLAARGHYPAVDVMQSKSRLMRELVSPEHRGAAEWATRAVATWERNYDKISLDLYVPPSEEERRLVESIDDVNGFLQQSLDDPETFDDTAARLIALANARM